MNLDQSMWRSKKVWILVISIIAFCLSLVFVSEKKRALGFQQKDYAFYAQFAAKLGDENLTNRYSLNPNGRNMFGFHGVEGEGGFHKTIHFVGSKYIYALLYSLGGNIFFVFAFISAILFSVPSYLYSSASQNMSREDQIPVFWVSLTYLLWPTTWSAVGYDLRSYNLLAPMSALLFIAILYKKNRIEIFLMANALCLMAREEGLFIAGFLIALGGLRARGSKESGFYFFLAANWFLLLIVTLIYYKWAQFPWSIYGGIPGLPIIYKWIAGYPHLLALCKRFLHHLIFLVMASAFMAAALLFIWIVKFPKNHRHQKWISVSLVLLPALAVFVQLLALELGGGDTVFLKQFFTSPRWHLFFTLCLLALFLFRHLEILSRRWIIRFCMVLSTVGFLSLFLFDSSPAQLYTTFKKRGVDASLVWDLRNKIDPYYTSIVTDYPAYQAFYEFENVYCFQRLPLYMVPTTKDRYFPENEKWLKKVLNNARYIVIRNDNDAMLRKALEITGTKDQFDKLKSNGNFTIYTRSVKEISFNYQLVDFPTNCMPLRSTETQTLYS